MLQTLEVEPFLNLQGPLYDVRSPGEFLQGTIPSSLSLPLFSDQERADIGTVYKTDPTQAFLLGLEKASPKLVLLAQEGLKRKSEVTRLFCFRGGQRSGSVAWLFRLFGIPTITLKGGYKAFRRFCLNTLSKQYNFQVLGGLSGSGKTALLKHYRNEGKQILDLEAMANHKGSAFGRQGTQPSNEAFENALSIALHHMDPQEPIWIEDESRMIGTCKIPDAIYLQMKQAPLYLLEASQEQRLQRLIAEYGGLSQATLIQGVHSLTKRLGEVRVKKIIAHIQDNRLSEAALMLLDYYDKAYIHGLQKRPQSRERLR